MTNIVGMRRRKDLHNKNPTQNKGRNPTGAEGKTHNRYADLDAAISDASKYGLDNQTKISNGISKDGKITKIFLYILLIVSCKIKCS
jgi:hypothetical protein